MVVALALALAVQPVAYTWRNVEIVGGGFVTGIITHPTAKGLVYARTDIGGAYRFDNKTQRWKPLQDWITRPDWNLYGAESLAVDPTDADRVYIAAGTYTNEWGQNGAILRSGDRGETWQRTDLPFKNGGNEEGRSIGERLQVDPSMPAKILFGTRHDGLWESLDRGVTWHASASWKGEPGRQVGVGWELFLPDGEKAGQPTKTILAAEIDPMRNLWVSRDAGLTWEAVPGQPKGFLAEQAKRVGGGRVFVTFCDHPGPNGATDGAVWALTVATGTWEDVTPVKPSATDKFGYAGVTVGPEGAVMVSTLDRWGKDTAFRTLDGGRTWVSLADKAMRDTARAKYLEWGRGSADFGHWIGDIEIDPTNPDQAWYVTGATIWRTRDLRNADKGKPTHWVPGTEGLEETAVIDLVSPAVGAHVLSALGDINGFAHYDLTKSPPGGMYQNPLNSTCDDVDYAGGVPLLCVRVGRGNGDQHGGISTDGGTTWKPSANDAPGGRGGGTVAVSANGQVVVWSSSAGASWTSDRGMTWTPCEGAPKGYRVVSDKFDTKAFYLQGAASGEVWRSTDGGKTFTLGASHLPKEAGKMQAWLDKAGELWLPTPEGLLVSKNGGVSFAPTARMIVAEQVGLGMPAMPDGPVALYVIGAVDGRAGVWWSIDGGISWIQINDAKTGFGTMQVIEGDPKKFGRVYLGTNGRGIVYGDQR